MASRSMADMFPQSAQLRIDDFHAIRRAVCLALTTELQLRNYQAVLAAVLTCAAAVSTYISINSDRG